MKVLWFARPVAAILLLTMCTANRAQVTLSQLTANNTSACPASGPLPAHCREAFRGQQDLREHVATPLFDQPAGNVSDEDIHEYLSYGRQTKIFANFMLGFCTEGGGERCHNNVRTGYKSDDDRTVAAQVEDLRRRHIDGAIMSWEGSGTSEDNATLKFQRYVNERYCSGPQQCDLGYVIMYDGASMAYSVGSTGIHSTSSGGCAKKTGKDYEDCVVRHVRNDMCEMNGMHWGNDAYLKSNGRPVVLIFPSEGVIPASGPAPSWADMWKHVDDWNKKLPKSCGKAPYDADNGVPLMIFEHAVGFGQSGSAGAYPWIGVAGTDPDREQFHFRMVAQGDPDSLDHFFQAGRKNPGKLTWGIAYKGFNSSGAAWGTNRILDQECGRVWVSTLTASNQYFIDTALPYLQIATWNDYNEGTEIESGIDNCITVSAAMDGTTLSWTLNTTNRTATIATVSHIEIYDSTDGQNLKLIESLPAAIKGTWNLDALAPGSHQIYVRMVGKNSIINRISSAVPFTKEVAPGQ